MSLTDADPVYYLCATVVEDAHELPAGQAARGGYSVLPDAAGWFLQVEPATVEPAVLQGGFQRCLAQAQAMLAEAEAASRFAVESLTLKLGLDAKLGCVFVGETTMSAAIEVKLVRDGASRPAPSS